MKQLIAGIILGWSLQFLVGAQQLSSEGERQLENMKRELETSNRHLDQISRSLDRIDDAFASGQLRVKTER